MFTPIPLMVALQSRVHVGIGKLGPPLSRDNGSPEGKPPVIFSIKHGSAWKYYADAVSFAATNCFAFSRERELR